MKPVVIAGGSGTLGRALARHLATQGHLVSILTRNPQSNSEFQEIQWNGIDAEESWGSQLSGCILINLAGELVDRVPTEENIDLLERSRVLPTRALATASNQFGAPSLWLQMSTLAIYGDAGERDLTEISRPADGPRQMAGVAKAWEAAMVGANADRTVILRTAVVLQPSSPALDRLLTITKRFMGGTVGNGQQWVSWIHIEDFLRAIDFLIGHQGIQGVVHVTSPSPIRNRDMMKALRGVARRPWVPPIPKFAIQLGARLLFRTDPQLALTGRRGLPNRLLREGFEFRFPNFAAAIQDLVK
ncbi:TIGR01777 family oxidoreductase [Rhodoluna limnophila]|uniref:TIGR01777 family oxidoreductase n=1 Tax=Rhodoluna limnophila TaxID=232537 RepID=UPI001107219A|nr:TIGR01777 family oxidoreductase [Rhodoluna limnophila]